jgi:hypothetical protein
MLFAIVVERINSFSYCCRCQATTLKRITKKTRHVAFTVSSLQALQFQYIILIPYILDDLFMFNNDFLGLTA